MIKEDKLLLHVKDVSAAYRSFQVLWDVSLNLEVGEYVCLLGPNGAGKSTLLKTIAGVGLSDYKGGSVLFEGKCISGLPGYRICEKGISYVSEESNLFTNMTVRENLAMGAYIVRNKRKRQESLNFVFELFPPLEEREKQLAGTMSGGERKMLAIARGLMSAPRLLLMDEPSLGLAPLVTSRVFDVLGILVKKGVTILIVEQNAIKTLEVTNRGYVLEEGRIVLEGRNRDLAQNDYIKKVYLGI